MVTKVFKLFFSHIKEEKWLNEMGQKGYFLTGLVDSRYTFEHDEAHTYSYCIQNIGASANSDIATEYFGRMQGEGINPIIASGHWIIFCKKDGEILPDAEVIKKNSITYKVRTLYYYGFSLVLALVSGYQLYAVNYLESVGYKSGPIGLLELAESESFLQKIGNAAKSVVNFLADSVNSYFNMWIRWLSKCQSPTCTTVEHVCGSDAIRVLSVLIPILVILILFGTFNLDEWISHAKRVKDLKKADLSTDTRCADTQETCIHGHNDAEENDEK